MTANSYDEDFLQRARSGDALAGPMLISLLGDRLLGFARSVAPDLSDADREQIVELAVEAGVRAIQRFDPKRGTLYSWFRQQVRYQTLQWRRTHPLPATTMPDDLPDLEVGSDGESPSWFDDPLVRQGLAAAIAKLNPNDRLVLAIRSAESLAFSEIALRLDISETAARQRHKRALDRLRKFAQQDEALTARFATPKEGTTA